MKISRRLLLGTLLVLLAAPVAVVAYSRIVNGSAREMPAPERTSLAALSALRDFTAIDARGDFTLEVFNAPDFSVEYTALSATRGNFRANVVDDTLIIEGYGNRAGDGDTAATVRIGLPELAELDAESLFTLEVSGFDQEAMDVSASAIPFVVIAGNRLGTLDLELQFTRTVQLNGNTLGTSNVRHFDTVITTTE